MGVSGEEPPWVRPVKGAAVGGGLELLNLWAVRAALTSSTCRNAPGYGCMGLFFLWYFAAPILMFGISWGLLRLLGVRPAWQAALLGVLTGALLSRVGLTTSTLSTFSYSLAIVYAVAFALATFLTRSRTGPLWRLGIVAALVLLLPISQQIARHRAAEGRDDELARSPVPLLAPTVPAHYRLLDDTVVGDRLDYVIVPDHPGGPDAPDGDISVYVGPVQPGFDPPTRCPAETAASPVPDMRQCTPVRAGVWRWTAAHYVDYITRVGNTVAVTEAPVPEIPENVLVAIATSMRVRPRSYFPGN
jgi:hypothetical protein